MTAYTRLLASYQLPAAHDEIRLTAAKGGYQKVLLPPELGGLQIEAHLLACQLAWGPRPDGMVATHLCRGVPGCFFDQHLAWRTPREARALAKPRDPATLKLSPGQRQEIRKAYARGVGLRELGRRYGVADTTILPVVRS